MSTRSKLDSLIRRHFGKRLPSNRSELVVYCSGGIAKSTDKEPKLCWANEEKAAVERGAGSIRIAFLDPADPLPELSDSAALFGRDMFQIQLADAVVVDARQRRGIGIGIEMLAASSLGTRLLAVVPPNSHYRRDDLQFRGGTVADYVHPHLASLCDAVVNDFEEAGKWLAANATKPPKASSEEVIDIAIQAYRERLLSSDKAMQSGVIVDSSRRRNKRRPALAPWFGARS